MNRQEKKVVNTLDPDIVGILYGYARSERYGLNVRNHRLWIRQASVGRVVAHTGLVFEFQYVDFDHSAYGYMMETAPPKLFCMMLLRKVSPISDITG